MRYILALNVAAIPVISAISTLPAGMQVAVHPPVVIKHTAEQCKASAIYYEARGEPIEGQRAVLDVIEHRKKYRKLTSCQVVKQKYQFSWYNRLPIREYNAEMKKLYTKVRSYPKVLRDEMYQYFFHKDMNPQPKWAENMICKDIGNHRFCRERRKDEIQTS